MKIHISSISRGSHQGSARSEFLSAFMKKLSNHPTVVEAFHNKDIEAFNKAFEALRNELISKEEV